eukprot:5911407-Amphidinium_carterae.1
MHNSVCFADGALPLPGRYVLARFSKLRAFAFASIHSLPLVTKFVPFVDSCCMLWPGHSRPSSGVDQ